MIVRNFFVFEGIDGTGTTTQLKLIKERFLREENEGRELIVTCEPTTGPIGELIRRGLSGEYRFTADTMARLFAADRGEHIYGSDGILEQTKVGKTVISDRYLFSTLAYQGSAGDPQLAAQLNAEFPLPEYLFYFDLDADAAMNRVEKRNARLEIYEKREFQRILRNRYASILEHYRIEHPEMKIVVIDASLGIQEISEKIWSIIRNKPIIET